MIVVTDLPRLLARLPERWRWTAHNLVAHPLSEILYQVGLRRWSDLVHDITIPEHTPGSGRV
ncbi:MAG: hypothetical protein EBT97_09835 [Actinobacteria bacterium]|nr:hypothetical protein [Actinomycetota bacterium]